MFDITHLLAFLFIDDINLILITLSLFSNKLLDIIFSFFQDELQLFDILICLSDILVYVGC